MVRRSLGRQLKALRLEARKTFEDVSDVGQRDKIWRMETGKGPYRIPDVQSLCRIYGADEGTIIRLTDLAAKSRGDSLYEEYSDVLPSWFATYFELEAAAQRIRTYQSELVDGLFQTPDYARAVFRAGRQAAPAEVVERQVVARTERQQKVFGKREPVQVEVVLGEGALARMVGGPAVMAAQVTHLRGMATKAGVHIRVLTWQAGAHAAMEGAFTLLDFDDPEDPSVSYIETYAGARYLERPVQVSQYQDIFELIHQQSIPLEEYAP